LTRKTHMADADKAAKLAAAKKKVSSSKALATASP
jgi:hypothetical protein